MKGWDPGQATSRARLHLMLRLVRIEHTLFSLPFAYLGAVLSCPGCLDLWNTILIGLAVLGLRTASMSYNNIADLDIDRDNPRTRGRPLASGALTVRDAWILVALGSVVYYASALLLNEPALILSPILWILAMSYPHHKRALPWSHYHLGLVLGFIVFGGGVAVCGECSTSMGWILSRVPWIYLLAVTFWVAGFDIPYSIQDVEFDRSHGLHSIPSDYGEHSGLVASRITHLLAGILFTVSVPLYNLGILSLAGTATGLVLLIAQHYIIRSRGRNGIPVAFNLNMLIGILVPLSIIIDVLLKLYM
ncbi:MAG: putative 4-hydroxybenzoate polyprenyltransferase [Desulfurococcales archaeon]|nr:putative 4-hydroxybenzoate polyprenyltransferase [Desulfurococcales archaeon]